MAGRPAFQPTRAQRNLVATAAGGGASQLAIARALGLSLPCLRKHFADELSWGAGKRRVDVVVALYAAAMRGNVAAMKRYLANEPEEFKPPR